MKTEPSYAIQRLFSFLLNPQPTDQKSHKNINWKSLFTKENFENLSLDNDLLELYANHMQKNCLIRENSFKRNHRAYACSEYYYSLDENFFRINNAIRNFDFNYSINIDGQFTAQGIIDLTTAILLQHHYKDNRGGLNYMHSMLTTSNDLKDLLNLLLDQKTSKLHHVEIINSYEKNLIVYFNLPEGKKRISLRPLWAEEIKRLSLDKELLNRYVNYMSQFTFIKENELKFEHPAYSYAAQYYFEDPKLLELPNDFCSVPSPYQFKVERLTNLDELKSLTSKMKSHYEIYIIIVQPDKSLPTSLELYCSQPGKDLIESNLIALHHKIIFQNELKYLAAAEINSKYLKNIEDRLKKFFFIDVNDYYQLSVRSIIDLATYIILINHSFKYYQKHAINLKLNYQLQNSAQKQRTSNSQDVKKLLNYLLDSKLIKSHFVNKERMTFTFNFRNNTTDIISLNNFYTEENIEGMSLDNTLLESYADYICRRFFIDETEFKFDHRAYACAASYVMQRSTKLMDFNAIINKNILYPDALTVFYSYYFKIRDVYFKTVANLEEIAELKISPDEIGDVYVIFVKPNSSPAITEIYGYLIEDSLSLSKPIKLHHKVEFKKYLDILNRNDLTLKNKYLKDITNKVKTYFSIQNQYRLHESAIAHLISGIILTHGLNGKELAEFRQEKKRSGIFSEIGTEKHIKKLLTYLLNPKSINFYSFNETDLTVTFHLLENKKEIIPLQCLFSKKNLDKLSLEENDLDDYANFMERNKLVTCLVSKFYGLHPAYQYAVGYYRSTEGYNINKLLRTHDFDFKTIKKYQNYEFSYHTVQNLDELDYNSFEFKKDGQIYIIAVNKDNRKIELYCSSFDKIFCKENLINLKEKLFFNNYIKKNPDIKDIENCYDLQDSINKEIKKFLNRSIKIFTTSTISYIATTIILSYFLNNSKKDPQDGFRVKSWKESCPFSIGHFLSKYDAEDQAFLSYSRRNGSFLSKCNFPKELYYFYIYSNNTPGLSISPDTVVDEILVSPRTKAHYRRVGTINNFTFYRVIFLDEKQNESILKYPSENIKKFFIEYLIHHFFSKEYEDASLCSAGLAWRPKNSHLIVYKPNHGILHAIRQAERIVYLLHAFSIIIAAPDFAKFCKDVLYKETISVLGEEVSTEQLLNELYMVAGSCAIGRESELSFDSNQEKYKEYRHNSMTRFTTFMQMAEGSCNFKISQKRLGLYKNILQNLGDPSYINSLTRFELWVMQLVNTTHILDVARCFPADLTESILSDRLGYLIKDPKQESIKELINFSVSWLQLTGDCIGNGYSINGYSIKSKTNYDLKFALYSTTQITTCLDILRASPIIVFPSEEQSKQDLEAMEKIAEHFFATLFYHRLDIADRWSVFKNLETLIRKVANVNFYVPEFLRNYLFEILLKKLTTNIIYKSKEECAGALMAASEEKHIPAKTVQYLLEAKISPNLKDSQDRNPLMQAILTSGDQQMEKIKSLLEFKGDPSLLNWKIIVDKTYDKKNTVGLMTQLVCQGHLELLSSLLNSSQDTIREIDWIEEIDESKGNSLFKITLNLIEEQSLSASYLEKLFYPALLLSLKWDAALIKIFEALLTTTLEYDLAFSKLDVIHLNALQQIISNLTDSILIQYIKFLIDIKSEKNLSADALKFKKSNPLIASSLFFINGSQLSMPDYYREVTPESKFYEEAQKRLALNL